MLRVALFGQPSFSVAESVEVCNLMTNQLQGQGVTRINDLILINKMFFLFLLYVSKFFKCSEINPQYGFIFASFHIPVCDNIYFT